MRSEVKANGKLPESIMGFGLKEIHGTPKTVYVVDTNILVNDPATIDNLQDKGTNAVVMPWIVISELDVLKTKPDLRRQVGDVVRVINRKLHAEDPNFYIAQGDISNYPDLDPHNPDHHVIATCLSILKDYRQVPVVLVSNDAMVHTVGICLGIVVQEYKEDQVSRVDFEKPLPRFCADDFAVDGVGVFTIGSDCQLQLLPVPHNGGAVLFSRDGSTAFPVIRKDDRLLPIRQDINALGVAPFSLEAEPNWAQYVALYQLLDPTISLVTLHGEAGTGKTLLSIAAALKQLRIEERPTGPLAGGNNLRDGLKQIGFTGPAGSYRKVYIGRPSVHLSNNDQMGFLPGDVNTKLFPWLAPLYDNIDFIASLNSLNAARIEQISRDKANGLEILPLSLIRGRTLAGAFVVIDEAQNLTRAEMKTIVTRSGEGTKLVLVGDINQIDIRWIDKRASGLTHVTVKMGRLPYFANTFLDQSVRSQIAKDAAELL